MPPQKEPDSINGATDNLFWLALLDFERRQASSFSHRPVDLARPNQLRSVSEVEDMATQNQNQEHTFWRPRSWTVDQLQNHTSEPAGNQGISQTYLSESTAVVSLAGYNVPRINSALPSCRPDSDFGPIGLSRKTDRRSEAMNGVTQHILPSVEMDHSEDLTRISRGNEKFPPLTLLRALVQNPSTGLWQLPQQFFSADQVANPQMYPANHLFGVVNAHALQHPQGPYSYSPYHPIPAFSSSLSMSNLALHNHSGVYLTHGSQQVTDPTQPSNLMVLGPPTPRNFVPTNMVLERNRLAYVYGLNSQPTSVYRGGKNSTVNRRQIPFLADALNCTLWLWNIPTSVHISEIFDVIDTGAIQCLHMMPPDETHRTCAAKLAFMVPEAAANFKRTADSEMGIWFHGKRLRLKYNRDGNLRNDMDESRVLIIEGPAEIMTVVYWDAYFRKICVFQWDRVLEFTYQESSRKMLQISFSRVEAQARACLAAIRTQEEFAGKVHADYGPDGCGSRAARSLEKHGVRLY